MREGEKGMRRKSLVLAALLTALVVSSSITSFAGEWKQDTTGWWYVNDDGSNSISKWEQINGAWYHFNENGYMETNWSWVDGKWYHMQDNGAMDANIAYETGYIGADGAWVSTKEPVGFWAATDEDIAYWNAMQVKYGIADIKYSNDGNGRFTYTVAMDSNLAVPDYENVFKSKACDDFNGFNFALNWNGNQMTFTVWGTDNY